MTTTTAERKTKEIIKKATEWKAQHGAQKTAEYIWNRYGYQTSVRDGVVILWGRSKVGSHRTFELARI
jgi:hypothetical protein